MGSKMMTASVFIFPGILICLALLSLLGWQEDPRSFTIDHDNNVFLLDGEPFRYAAGEVLYSRIPHTHWRPLLKLMHDGGLNAVSMYVPWSFHEIRPGEYDFATGDRDIVRFIETAADEGLFVLLRPGPYICAEWDLGGLPTRLLATDMEIRTSDERYMAEVRRWFGALMPLMKPLLYANGGPIIMVQVENEYGSYPACDKGYMSAMEQMLRGYLGDDVVYYTTDVPDERNLECGSTNTSFTTIDFGPSRMEDLDEMHRLWREFQPTGPFVNSELYSGWFDHWGEEHHTVKSEDLLSIFKTIWGDDYDASVSFYMYHGGSNYLWNGANIDNGTYKPTTTSYDYNAPIDQAGRPTDKWFLLQEVLVPEDQRVTPTWPKTAEYGNVEFDQVAYLTDAIANSTGISSIKMAEPLSLESAVSDLGIPSPGHPITLVAYTHTLATSTLNRGNGTEGGVGVLSLCGVHDLAVIYLDWQLQGTVSRVMEMSMGNSSAAAEGAAAAGCDDVDAGTDSASISITFPPDQAASHHELLIIVESLGHINYVGWKNLPRHGPNPMTLDKKGLTSSVLLDGHLLTGWTTQPIPLSADFISSLPFTPIAHKQQQQQQQQKEGRHFALFRGTIDMPAQYAGQEELPDTFLDVGERNGWRKGMAFVNGFNVGRYWPQVGPQERLFVPGSVLRAGEPNEVVLLDTDGPQTAGGSLNAPLVADPDQSYFS
ncbi:unnamed protein product [Vitrella brassicaformis CCMP3155]|uniref:Beta-galactosidase n=2 Tax=Vitrella brassicaformis TaxID=1169539 RepID=A0A0G4EEU5_VITBC|nr:unnamed protein product [Vitrella brassicaformis CCMP3155]|mmetsp:Transcript_31659/g.78436  ORF Transcript_31659/g.78436 Transcript_31659/m.78436 type:complete len:712 (+) Transcript_31659:260-2395(+)|eukprot:CEL94206.1 unnamed protein product [Vitrella brassicaformis CCMP3155]